MNNIDIMASVKFLGSYWEGMECYSFKSHYGYLILKPYSEIYVKNNFETSLPENHHRFSYSNYVISSSVTNKIE